MTELQYVSNYRKRVSTFKPSSLNMNLKKKRILKKKNLTLKCNLYQEIEVNYLWHIKLFNYLLEDTFIPSFSEKSPALFHPTIHKLFINSFF